MSELAGVRPIIDTHVHLDDPAFDMDRDDVLAASRVAGVVHFINIGYCPASWDASRRLREQHPDVGIALGLHPGHADEYEPTLDRALVAAIESMRPLAIGETGFDFSRPRPSITAQEQAFRRQLAIASEYGLPVIIHQRQAGDALRTELDRWPDLHAVVLHSFDGDGRLVDWAIERRLYIGVGGLAARPRSADLRALLARVPTDRILLETDSPYLAPPGAPSRRNTPANLPVIAELLAPLWQWTPAQLRLTTTANARSLFGLDLDRHVAPQAG